MIVRNPQAEQNITNYIRMNPWRCITSFDPNLRGMGNPALWNAEKLGVLASRNAPRLSGISRADKHWLPHINPGGMLDRLLKEYEFNSVKTVPK